MAITITQGLPSAADILLEMDALGSIFKGQYANIGVFAESETTTLAGLTRVARNKIMGDGTTTYPGLANTDMQKIAADTMKTAVGRARYDLWFQQYSPIFTGLDNLVKTNVPTGWNWSSSAGNRPLDLWLIYLNACNANTPVAPTFTPSLSGTTVAAGAIGQSGVTRVKCCYQSSSGDWLVGLPCTASSTITLTGKQNAITFTPAGNSTVTGYLLVFRQLLGAGAGDAYYFDQRVAVTNGVAHPAITMTQADQQLNLSLSPPSWLQCPLLPEEAFLYVDSYAAQPFAQGALAGFFTYDSRAFLTPSNVSLNPANTFLGLGNPAASGELGRWVDTALTVGSPATANDAMNVIQGFAGAMGGDLQFRVAGVLNASSVNPSITYDYYDSTHPVSGSAQSATTAAAGTLNTAVGSTLTVDVPAGRLVTAITAVSIPTTATGTIVIEAAALRSL